MIKVEPCVGQRTKRQAILCVTSYDGSWLLRPSTPSVTNGKANHSKQWVLEFGHCKAIKLYLPQWVLWFISAPVQTVIAQPQSSMEILIRRSDISSCYMVVILTLCSKALPSSCLTWHPSPARSFPSPSPSSRTRQRTPTRTTRSRDQEVMETPLAQTHHFTNNWTF